jgi:hypothetical protein
MQVSAPPSQTARPPRQHAILRWAVVLVCTILVGKYYLWQVKAAGGPFLWTYDLWGYYDLLGRGFASGHLHLPVEPSPKLLAQANPWDPALGFDFRWQDMVYYNRHYYLYFGAAPAVLLFAPWRIITHHDLPENFAIAVFAFGGFLFSTFAMLRILEFARVRAGPFLTAIVVLGLGFCQSVPFLLNRAAVYEIAICSGYFCVSGGIFFLVRSLRSARAPYFLVASGVMFGLAVACRPHLILAGLSVFAGIAIVAFRRGSLTSSREVRAFLAGWAFIGVCIAIYNYQRFGNPVEFGFRYQLAGIGQNRIELAAHNWSPGIYYMLLARPEFTPVFPWFRMVFRFPYEAPLTHPFPPEYFIEPTVGALWVAPFLLAVFFVPGSRRLSSELRVVLWCITAAFLAILLFLMSTHLASHRYEVDFLQFGVFAGIAVLAIRTGASTGWRRRMLGLLLGAVIVYSSLANLALGIAGPYDDMFKLRPSHYVRLSREFTWIPEHQRMLNPEIVAEFTATFVPEQNDFRDPLLTIGLSQHRHLIYAVHGEGKLRIVSHSEENEVAQEIPDPGNRPVAFRVRYSPKTRLLTTTVDGTELLQHHVETLVTAPSQVVAGKDRSDFSVIYAPFQGRILSFRKKVREAPALQ